MRHFGEHVGVLVWNCALWRVSGFIWSLGVHGGKAVKPPSHMAEWAVSIGRFSIRLLGCRTRQAGL